MAEGETSAGRTEAAENYDAAMLEQARRQNAMSKIHRLEDGLRTILAKQEEVLKGPMPPLACDLLAELRTELEAERQASAETVQ